MEIYLVGGAVRDKLLGRVLQNIEHDWVVVGSSIEQMLSLGYRQVGKSFPVFLHKETQEEYALARTERKNGHGYHGFSFCTSPIISLEDDLKRRDLTINAIAMDKNGQIIDPLGGEEDIKNRILRHISNAYIDDPLRLFRTCRFVAQLAEWGFTIAEDTLKQMHHIVQTQSYDKNGSKKSEIDYLPSERIWKETKKALLSTCPSCYFKSLHSCGALQHMIQSYTDRDKIDMPILKAVYKEIQKNNKDTDNILWLSIAMLLDLIIYKNRSSFSSDIKSLTDNINSIAYTFGVPKTIIDQLDRIIIWIINAPDMKSYSPEQAIEFFTKVSLWRRYIEWENLLKFLILSLPIIYTNEKEDMKVYEIVDFLTKKVDNAVVLLLKQKFTKEQIGTIDVKNKHSWVRNARISTIVPIWD